MASLPRILIVDPLGATPQLVRAALTLLDRAATFIEVPADLDAIDELQYGAFALVVTALHIGEAMDGIGLALHIQQHAPETRVVVVADETDPDGFSHDTSYLYLRRPFDAHQFVRLVTAALDGQDVVGAAAPTASTAVERSELGTIPALDLKAAQRVLETLLNDVGAMAVVLVNRAGDVLLERGAVGYINREQLGQALLSTIEATRHMKPLVGGHSSDLFVYDGDQFDVFVLSAGLHYALACVFDGQNGSRVLGSVNRYGRRAAQDLIALIDANVMIAEPPPEPRKKTGLLRTPPQLEETLQPVAIASAELDEPPAPVPEKALKLDPILDFDVSLFDTNLATLDISAFDDMFDADTVQQLADETRLERGPLSYEEARNLGLVP